MIYRSTPRYLCWFLWKIKPYYKFISFTDVLGLAFLLILSSFFSPALLRYDGHITFCQFKVYDKHTIPNNSWSEVAQLCPTLCNPMDCSLQGSSFHGIFQARVLEWVAISSNMQMKNIQLLVKQQCSPTFFKASPATSRCIMWWWE